MHEIGFVIFVVAFASFCWWLGLHLSRAASDGDELLPPREPLLCLPPALTTRRARHPRIEIEVHAHRHWGLQRERFPSGAFAGWALHVGVGVACVCVDYYERGRRP